MPEQTRPYLYDVTTRQPTRKMIEPDPKVVDALLHTDHGFDFDFDRSPRRPRPMKFPTSTYQAPRIIPLRKHHVEWWTLGAGCFVAGVLVAAVGFTVMSAIVRGHLLIRFCHWVIGGFGRINLQRRRKQIARESCEFAERHAVMALEHEAIAARATIDSRHHAELADHYIAVSARLSQPTKD